MPLERQDICDALSKKGFRVATEGDHDRYWFYHNGVKQAIFTKISRGKQYRTYGDNLLSQMAWQLKVTKPLLVQLVDCTLTEAAYTAHLKQSGINLASPPPPGPSAPGPSGKKKRRGR